ncbi:MAG: J domain-containing protein [Bryobacteraceae bacterium]
MSGTRLISFVTEKRRYPRRKPFATQPHLCARVQVDGESKILSARLLDIGRGGLRIELSHPVGEGDAIDMSGEIEDLRGKQKLDQKCYVQSCTAADNGTFVVRLSYESKKAQAVVNTSADLYEILQLSRNADFDTIQRVFRIFAQRYHPDNQDTGNSEIFQRVIEAHLILSDPERRAAYDLQTQHQAANKFKLFDSWQDTQGTAGERRIRKGVLTILYRHRQLNPRLPEVSLIDIAEALGVPREHLEFSLWFLRESKYIRNADSGRLEITLAGVLSVEEDEAIDRRDIVELPAIEAAN